MSKQVFKQAFGLGETRMLIYGAQRVVHVAEQFGRVTVWFETGDRSLSLELFGTGHPVPDDAQHRGSILCLDGALVLHLYEIVPQ